MGHWDASTWIAALTAVVAAVGVVVAIVAWKRPKSPGAVQPPPHEQLRVEVANQFPVFDRPDGSRDIGDHMVSVTARNGTGRPVRATSWGIRLPGKRTIAVMNPTTAWEPRMPHWIAPGDEATWYIQADLLRAHASAEACGFDDMKAYVQFADGREIAAERGIPLA